MMALLPHPPDCEPIRQLALCRYGTSTNPPSADTALTECCVVVPAGKVHCVNIIRQLRLMQVPAVAYSKTE